MLAGGTSSLVLLAACQQPPSASQSQQAAPPAPTVGARVVATSSAPGPAVPTAVAANTGPTSAPAQAAPASAPAAAKGKFSYAFHTAIPPAWLDPQENPPQVTPYNFSYTLHDALVKPMPGKDFVPSLAESYEIAPDFKSATFKLRPNIKFHDGSPVTTEDVKFTYENYRGASAGVLKAK